MVATRCPTNWPISLSLPTLVVLSALLLSQSVLAQGGEVSKYIERPSSASGPVR